MRMSLLQPKDKVATICLLVGILGVMIFAETLILPPARAIGIPLGAVVFCSLMVFPLPAIRKGISIELRARMISWVVILSTGIEVSTLKVLRGGEFPEPLTLVITIVGAIALTLITLYFLEPMVYRFLGGKDDKLTDK
jgi:hypothetical protein